MYTKTPRPLDSLHIGSKQHSCGPLHPSCAKATTSPAISSTHLADVEADGYSVVKPTASTSTKGIEDTDDDVLWIQWPSSDELEAVGLEIPVIDLSKK